MTDINKLGLGCMNMNFRNKERSIETIHYALDNGISLLNTGEFYGAGESEMVLREALQDVPRDKYFLSLKFGVLPKPEGGIYGLDVKPWNIKAHLTYSLHRLGLEYVDLYQPARMDESIPVEEVIGAIQDLVKEGYVRHIGLTEVDAEQIKKASTVHPIKMIEFAYSMVNRNIEENGVLEVAQCKDIDVLAFGVLNHGLLTNQTNTSFSNNSQIKSENDLISFLTQIANTKGITVEHLAQAYVYAKHSNMQVLIGTTRKEHLQDAIDSLSISLTDEEVSKIDSYIDKNKKISRGLMRNITFKDGKVKK